MSEITQYRMYLAIDRAVKRIEAAGGVVDRIAYPTRDTAGQEAFWRRRRQHDLDAGEVPNLYRFAALQVYLHFDKDYTLEREEMEAAAQQERERFILEFVDLYSDTFVARHDGTVCLFFENEFDGFGTTINVGQAMCERVQTGTRVVTKPAPDAPTIDVVEPVYGWRCNDAELLGVQG